MQTLINKLFILLIISSHTLFGCAICTLYSPETLVSIEVKADENRIKTANITWVLSKEFTDQLKEIYDQNQDNNLLKDELIPIEDSIVDYVKDKNYLVHISYDKIIDKEYSKKAIIKSKKTYVKNGLLHFNYLLSLDYEIKKDNILYLNIEDDENYFVLLLAKNGIKFDAPFKTEQVLNKQSVAFYTNSSLIKNSDEEIQKVKLEKLEKLEDVVNQDEEELQKLEVKKEETYLEKFSIKVKEYLIKIEKGDDYALFILLGISFIYGMIHALGPGHGKSLAFSYFASNKSSYLKAFWVSQASAFVHIIGALILVMVSVFILQSMLNNFVNDSVEILTKVSALMIILLAIYILYNKLNNKDCSCSSCCSSEAPVTSSSPWSTQKPKTVNNNTKLKPNFMKKDLYFVLTAGLIPCPGTVVLFIYAFILKTYFAVILASIFISLGMGLVIFVSSFLGVSVHNLSERSHKITNALEILAPVVMLLLGILLFLNADII